MHPPVLRVVRPHELPVGVEEDPDASVAPGDPDGQHRRLEPRTQVELCSFVVALIVQQETHVVATLHANAVHFLRF